ncbi:MAG: hypothetical protein ACRYG2_15915 [Janthinobacterium lividum]
MPPREALQLLPRLPATAWNRASGRWDDALRSLDVVLRDGSGGPEPDDLLVVQRAREALTVPANLVLLDGRDRAGRLQRAGYQVRTYAAQRAEGGGVRLAPLRALRPWTPAPSQTYRRTTRQRLVALVRRCAVRRYVTIAHRGSLTPAAVAAAGLEAQGVLLAGGGGARRRSTFLVPSAPPGPAAAVKVAPGTGRQRGIREQEVLRRLSELEPLSAALPRPLGEGVLGEGTRTPLCWSAETALVGRSLPDVVHRLGAARSRVVLQDLTEWFTRLGELTRTSDGAWDARSSDLPLRAEHTRLAELRPCLEGVPGVLVHGDVGTGGNVLVSPSGFGIIDWETASDTELPLTDLLPLLCLALASDCGTDDRARYVLRLCAGQESDSAWLLTAVRAYCQRVGVEPRHAGGLGALAWGYQASMRLVHEELVTAAGGTPSSWVSPADQVARSWSDHPGLGPSWPALTSGWPR